MDHTAAPHGSTPTTQRRPVVPLQQPGRLGQAKSAQPRLAQEVDDLLALRALLKRSQEMERVMTAEILQTMQAAGLDRLDGNQGVATISTRTCLTIEPELFIGLTGPKGYAAMKVSVEKARDFLGEQTIQDISESTTTPALLVREKKSAA